MILRFSGDNIQLLHRLVRRLGLDLPEMPGCTDCSRAGYGCGSRVRVGSVGSVGFKEISMPTYKPELTRKEQAKYLSIAKEQRRHGTRVEIPREWQENSSFLARYDCGLAGKLDNPDLPVDCSVRFSGENTGRTERNLQEFEVADKLGPGHLSMLPRGADSLSICSRTRFNVKEVLNDHIERDLHFRRGDIREGWLLAMGNKPFPKSTPPASLRLWTSYWWTSSRIGMLSRLSFLLNDRAGPPGSVAKPKTSL